MDKRFGSGEGEANLVREVAEHASRKSKLQEGEKTEQDR